MCFWGFFQKRLAFNPVNRGKKITLTDADRHQPIYWAKVEPKGGEKANSVFLLWLWTSIFSCLLTLACAVLSRFSCVWLFVTWTVAHQAPLSMGFLQARILKSVVMPSPRRSSQFQDLSQVSCLHCRQILYCLSHQGSLLTLELFILVIGLQDFIPGLTSPRVLKPLASDWESYHWFCWFSGLLTKTELHHWLSCSLACGQQSMVLVSFHKYVNKFL